jgi:hypothetical protein
MTPNHRPPQQPVPKQQHVSQNSMNPLENNSNFNRSGQFFKPEEKVIPRNHNEIPLPKILTKKNEQRQGNFMEESNYPTKKSGFNDYMSPDLMPTSPRQILPNKNSLGKLNSGSSLYYNSK